MTRVLRYRVPGAVASPAPGQLLLTGFPPGLPRKINVPGPAGLLLTGLAPTVSVGGGGGTPAPDWEDDMQYASDSALRTSSKYFFSTNTGQMTAVTDPNPDWLGRTNRKVGRFTIPGVGQPGSNYSVAQLRDFTSDNKPEMWINLKIRFSGAVPSFVGTQEFKLWLLFQSTGSRWNWELFNNSSAGAQVCGIPNQEAMSGAIAMPSVPTVMTDGAWKDIKIHIRAGSGSALARFVYEGREQFRATAQTVTGAGTEMTFGPRPMNVQPSSAFYIDWGYRGVWWTNDPNWTSDQGAI